jgi:hypothetical protein
MDCAPSSFGISLPGRDASDFTALHQNLQVEAFLLGMPKFLAILAIETLAVNP